MCYIMKEKSSCKILQYLIYRSTFIEYPSACYTHRMHVGETRQLWLTLQLPLRTLIKKIKKIFTFTKGLCTPPRFPPALSLPLSLSIFRVSRRELTANWYQPKTVSRRFAAFFTSFSVAFPMGNCLQVAAPLL